MKKITINSWAPDNAGSYHEPGTELVVSDAEGKEGHIHPDLAQQLAEQDAARAALAPAQEAPATDGEPAAE